MIKLKNILKESVEGLKQEIGSLYKEYQKQLNAMYGPDGIETRAAAATVARLGDQGSFGSSQKATSPEMDKISQERSALMKQMGELGSKINDLYQKLEDAGQGALVKQMRAYQAKETEKFILGVADAAEQKAVEDSKDNIKKLGADQQKAIDNLEKLMKANNDKYRMDYRKWLEGSQDTPPPIPPTLPIRK
jgi:cytochrome c556